MGKRRNKLSPHRILTVDASNSCNIVFIVTDESSVILHMTNIPKEGQFYSIRHNLVSTIDNLIQDFNLDAIILENNKLFIDKIDKYPDPFILRNVLLGFGISITIEDRYYDKLAIIYLAEYDWKNSILGRKTPYVMDLYKAHILNRTDIPIKYLVDIENNNYYKAICLSESVLFDNLMNKKYQINKGDFEVE